ncbi:hypothetical protein P152DRAFT_510481 [Eremomyces bilateralis CBS 781.70]|uniref:ATPase synthesis protein 25 n=1 Tax=Eremomyces bilateralis CBS 781.70 TaxID=1392243 RepID=A0A6G1GGH5_9PEZI|nr:uncharacterized protein P152DRAFT_510481 [Eremomyces bilateralis CBS 781.70]KAF1817205.1 hypothetical protein P152DRAFT_510481 [Eremomyces bilateralis CBS 781.70]
MAAPRALISSLRCTGCRSPIVRPFLPSYTERVPPPRRELSRLFTTSIRKNVEIPAEGSHNSRNDTPEPSPDSSLPWYLQPAHRQPTLLTSPIASAPLPDLPSNPPPLLAPLLSHINEGLGLTDISLLDLRQHTSSISQLTAIPESLHPPTLGPSLLMLIATARSTPHLHLSSQRLCRWLRTEWKLRARADGLLGRGELRRIGKRKAKKARTLARRGLMENAMGGAMGGMGEEGNSSGWVCVYVPGVKAGELEDVTNMEPENDLTEIERHDGFVGFDETEQGSTVVVQVMTEAKRAELDLEGLWSGWMHREQKRWAKIDFQAEEKAREISEVVAGDSDRGYFKPMA